jgi:hypothetical protein
VPSRNSANLSIPRGVRLRGIFLWQKFHAKCAKPAQHFPPQKQELHFLGEKRGISCVDGVGTGLALSIVTTG